MLTAADIARVWSEVITFVDRRLDAPAPDGLRQPLRFELRPNRGHGPDLIITTDTLRTALIGRDYGAALAESLYEVLGRRYKVGFESAFNRCFASVALLRSEIRRVRETPGVTYYRDDGRESHLAESGPNAPLCNLTGSHEQHAAEIGTCPDDGQLDIWITWHTGVHGSRAVSQPGGCRLLDNRNLSEFCLARVAHEGDCIANQPFFGPAVTATL